jgi:2-dehydro-3-deoxygluconokinase
MSDPKPRAVCVGEVMIELLRGGDGRFSIACGGDTFNTAIYMARAGADVAVPTPHRAEPN